MIAPGNLMVLWGHVQNYDIEPALPYLSNNKQAMERWVFYLGFGLFGEGVKRWKTNHFLGRILS